MAIALAALVGVSSFAETLKPLGVTPLPAPEQARLAELDRYWAEVSRAVKAGDFEGLLIKKQNGWKILMENQKGPATQAEWDALK